MLRKFRLLFYHLWILPEFFRVKQRIRQLSPGTRLFCFFPFYQTGGSEQVHADIVQAIGSTYSKEEIAIFFTKTSRSDTFKSFFNTSGQGIELAVIDQSAFRKALLKSLAKVINTRSMPVVFGANATFAYELIPFLESHIKFVDLTHSFVPESSAPIEKVSLPHISRITKRVVINQKVLEDFKHIYQQNGLDWAQWKNRFQVVPNRLTYPYWPLTQKEYTLPPLRVLFVGRKSPEKQISLIGKVADQLRNVPIEFTLTGAHLVDDVDEAHRPLIRFTGELTDRTALAELYKKHHVVLITSSREGFPLVLMEGMAHGCVPVSTRVGGIATHIIDNQNGLLVENFSDQNQTAASLADCLWTLLKNPALLQTLSQAAQAEAYASFSPDAFDKAWNRILSV